MDIVHNGRVDKKYRVLDLFFGIGMNIFGFYLTQKLGLPIWLDCVGTVLNSAVFGYGHILLSACITQVGLFYLVKQQSIFFIVIEIISRFLLGAFFHRIFQRFSERPRIDVVCLNTPLIALINTFLYVFLYDFDNVGNIGNKWGDGLRDMFLYLNLSPKWALLCAVFLCLLLDYSLSVMFATGLIRTYTSIFYHQPVDLKGGMSQAATLFLLITTIAIATASDKAAKLNIYYDLEDEDIQVESSYASSKNTEVNLNNFVFTYYDMSNGMSSSEAKAIAQNEDGFLWIGGQAGLSRFDGKGFDSFDTASVSNIETLYVDNNNRLWIGTNDKGTAIYSDGSFRYMLQGESRSSKVKRFAEAYDGTIYVASDGYIGKYVEGQGLATVSSLMKLYDCQDIVCVRDYLVVLCESGHIHLTKNDRDTGESEDGELSEDGRFTVLAGNKDRLYVGTSEGKINVYTVDYGIFKIEEILDPGFDDEISTITVDSKGKIWAAAGNKVALIQKSDNQIRDLGNFNDISNICEDYQGNLWLASESHGIARAANSPFVDIFRANGMDINQVYAIYQEGPILYCGTKSGVIVLSEIEQREIESGLKEYLKGVTINSITADKDGCVYLATENADMGIVCQDANGRIFNISREDGLNKNDVKYLGSLSDGTIVAGLKNGGMDYIYEGKVVGHLVEGRSMSKAIITSVSERNNGELLVGTDGDGMFGVANNVVRAKYSTMNNLPTNFVKKIVRYGEDAFIVTSSEICFFKDGKITPIHTFPFNNCYDMVIGGDTAYVATSKGLYEVKVTELKYNNVQKYKLYNVNSGLLVSLSSNTSNFLLQDGRILLCNSDGVLLYETNKKNDFNTDYRFGIEKVLADGTSIASDGEKHYTIPAGTKEIRIAPYFNNFSLNRCRVSVYLDGVDYEPESVIDRELSDYTAYSIKPGVYRFVFTIYDSMGETIQAKQSFIVAKEASIWEMKWFQMFALFMVLWFIGTLSGSLLYYVTRTAEERKIKDLALSRYVDDKIINNLINRRGKNLKDIRMRKDIAVLFIDIRSFTSISETLEANEVAELLNPYFDLVTRSVKKYGGTVDKFIGDAVMAVYNAPGDLEDYELNAIRSAMDIRDNWGEVEDVYEEIVDRRSEEKKAEMLDLDFGIGINCGEAMVGNIGTANHMDYTAIGDVVNTAQRIEGKASHEEILVSENMRERLQGLVETRKVGELELKGKKQTVNAYEVIWIKEIY